ncbi:hypothetical protein [Bifidobacterium aesculapii]|uniref:hypothetical protein n=1 Tax=Bifidobacterium aesculapii TaxID=1329411 RepID=UPI0006E1A713|nr:hypothetical protein [Bifidobacterium aesculapii]
MRIIERYCRGKRDDQSLNEDGLAVTADFAAVVDGVTSKSVRCLWQPSGGVVAKDLVLATVSSMPADATMREAQRSIDGRLRDAYRGRGVDVPAITDIMEREPVERLQANAVVYSAARHEAWLFGDCQIMVNGVQVPTVKRVDVLLGELRTFATLALREGSGEEDSLPSSPDPARELIMPFLRLQSRFANKRGPYGYFVFDGYTDPTYPIRTIHIHPGDEVVLASDGYPLLRSTLAESEHELARLKREDPSLIGSEYQSTKGFAPGLDSFDDRTYLRFVA